MPGAVRQNKRFDRAQVQRLRQVTGQADFRMGCSLQVGFADRSDSDSDDHSGRRGQRGFL